METKINEKDCLLKDLEIPMGYRVIEDWELLRELRTNKELQEIFKKGIWVNRMMGIQASWLLNFGSVSRFDAGGRVVVDLHDCLRGVFTPIK